MAHHVATFLAAETGSLGKRRPFGSRPAFSACWPLAASSGLLRATAASSMSATCTAVKLNRGLIRQYELQGGAQTLNISATAWEALLHKIAGSSSVRHYRHLMHCIRAHLCFVLVLQG